MFIKEDTDVSFKTAWQTSALQQVCTVQQMEQAAVRAHQELSNEELDRHLNVEDIETLWGQRPDRMAINHEKRIICIIEFKRTMDLRPSFQAKAEDRASRQYEWLAKTLTRAGTGSGWTAQMIVFTGGTMGSVKIDRFEHKLKALEVEKKNGPTSGNCMPEHF